MLNKFPSMTPYGSQSTKVSGLHVSIQTLQTGEHLSLGIVDNVSIDFDTATMKRKKKNPNPTAVI